MIRQICQTLPCHGHLICKLDILPTILGTYYVYTYTLPTYEKVHILNIGFSWCSFHSNFMHIYHYFYVHHHLMYSMYANTY